MKLPKHLEIAVDGLAKLPGVGKKTALRYALFLAQSHERTLSEFIANLTALRQLEKCQECGALSDQATCEICKDERRKESKSICIVESIVDCMAIEKSGQFNGLFHILGGVLNPLIGVGPDELGIDGLLKRIHQNNIEEIILAITPSVEGDITCSYIREQINSEIKVKRIGLGIPMGGSLEYLDTLTISKALENRTSF